MSPPKRKNKKRRARREFTPELEADVVRLSREDMRKSEALTLTWGDIDLARGAVSLDANKRGLLNDNYIAP